MWVDGRIYTQTPYWTCDTVFGNGCGATSDVSRDAIQHKPSCGIYKGQTVYIAESWTDVHWADLSGDSPAKDYARNQAEHYGMLTGWYDYV